MGRQAIDERYIFDRDMAWLRECDAVVSEVTQPSLGTVYGTAVLGSGVEGGGCRAATTIDDRVRVALAGVGYELGMAEALNKPVLCL